MAKKKRKSSKSRDGESLDAEQTAGNAADESPEVPDADAEPSAEPLESIELDVAIDDEGEAVDEEVIDISAVPNKRLATKRRLDAYLERKWFRENGWDDDDDLFKDEFFNELEEQG